MWISNFYELFELEVSFIRTSQLWYEVDQRDGRRTVRATNHAWTKWVDLFSSCALNEASFSGLSVNRFSTQMRQHFLESHHPSTDNDRPLSIKVVTYARNVLDVRQKRVLTLFLSHERRSRRFKRKFQFRAYATIRFPPSLSSHAAIHQPSSVSGVVLQSR